MPSVTCVIIFFNEEQFLGEAIESVLAQTFTDWELLIVDDGSSDRSVAIAQDYASAWPDKVRYLSHPGHSNRGKSASRNLGLHSALGEFVAFLDGDDVWVPEKLERQVAIFQQNPEIQMVCGATEYWHSWNPGADLPDNLRLTGESRDGPSLQQDRVYGPGELLEYFYPIGSGLTTSQSGYVIRRQRAIELGGFEARFEILFEDLLFLTKVFFECSVFISSRVYDRYRQHSGSSSNRASHAEWDRAKLHYLKWLLGYLRSHSFSDRNVLRKVRRQILRYRYPLLYRTRGLIAQRLARL